jgi:hypothetical protein
LFYNAENGDPINEINIWGNIFLWLFFKYFDNVFIVVQPKKKKEKIIAKVIICLWAR